MNFEEAKSMLKITIRTEAQRPLRVEEEWKSYIKEESQERNIQNPDHGSKNIEVSESGEICDG